MYFLIAPYKFSDFTCDEDVNIFLSYMRDHAKTNEIFNKTMSVVLYNLLHDIYELGSVTKNKSPMFNFVFCVEDNEVKTDILEDSIREVVEFCNEAIPQNSEIVIVTPKMDSDIDIEEVNKSLESSFSESNLKRNVRILSTQFLLHSIEEDIVN